MSIEYHYNRTGTERKALVDAVSPILEKAPMRNASDTEASPVPQSEMEGGDPYGK